ncbi:MAG TPA: alpha/beta hydrolase [Chryseosolibacter sp.]
MAPRKLIKITFPFLLLAGLYFLGPSADQAQYDLAMPTVPASADQLNAYVSSQEQRHKLKPDNEARIVWADSARVKTPYAIVYLHGFSACQKEGDPVHRRIAKAFGSNLYLSRLSDHGIDTTETLQFFTAERVWESAKEALAIGEAIGEKVILVSTSTGGTLALKLAAEYPERIHALINLSPNIAINNPAAFLLNDPWGLQIARMVMGGKYRETGAADEKSQYWNNKYRLEAVVELQELVESTMTDETFSRVKQPSLTLYYYKDEQHQDPEVKVSAMLEMHKKLGTPESLKVAKAIPNAGAHVIGGALASNDVETVYLEMEKFLSETVHVTKAPLAEIKQ